MATTFLKIKDNGYTTLYASITAAATTLTIPPGATSLFPATGNFKVDIYNNSNPDDASVSERLLVTNVSTNTWTVTRAQDGTVASVFSVGAAIQLNVIAQHIDDITTALNTAETTVATNTTNITTNTSSITTINNKLSGVSTGVILDSPALTSPTLTNAVVSGTFTLAADPSLALQAATKQYVDAVSEGRDYKGSVRCTTTVNITLSGLQTIDGITVIANDRVLVKNQTTQSQNGIYLASSGAWSRSTDADTASEFTAGVTIPVEEGTTQADTVWILTSNNPIVLGSTSLTFSQLGGGTFVPLAGGTMTGDLKMNTGGVTSYVFLGDSFKMRGNNGHIEFWALSGGKSYRFYNASGVLKSLIDVDTGAFQLINNVALQGRNAADSAYLSIAKINASNQVEIGASSVTKIDTDGTLISKLNSAADENFVYAGLNAQGIINGGCQVAQRGAATLSTTYQFGKVDRLAFKATGTSVSAGSITQNAAATIGTTGYSARLSGVTITGTGILYARYRMEADDALNFKNQVASFGLQVLHDVGSSISYTIIFRKPTVRNNFASVTTISTSSATVVATGTSTTVKSENVSLGDVSFGLEIEIQAACGAVTTKTFDFADLRMNKGTYLRPFQPRSFTSEIMDCARYFEKTFDMAQAPVQNCGSGSGAIFATGNGSGLSIPVRFNVRKYRVDSTVTTYNPVAANSSWRNTDDNTDTTASVQNVGDSGFRITMLGVVADTNNQMAIHWAAEGEIT